MKNKELYDKTISILVKAYLNDTLIHGDCRACAVGNIIKANYNGNPGGWSDLLESRSLATGEIIKLDWYNFNSEVKEKLDSTGYNVYQINKIEIAFEGVEHLRTVDERIYLGLMAVVEVLGEIHEVSKELTEETKLMFVK